MRLLLFLICLTSTTMSFSQLTLEVNGGFHNVYILGATSREADGNRDLIKLPKYHYGLAVSYPFSDRLSITLGLGYTKKGSEIDLNLAIPDGRRKKFGEGYLLDYWQVPLSVRYKFWDKKVKVHAELGGYTSFLRQAYHFYPQYDAWNDEYHDVVLKVDGFAKKDFGVKAGLASSYPLSSRWHVGLRIFSEWGVHKIMWKNEEWAGYNRSYGGQLFLEYVIWEKQKE